MEFFSLPADKSNLTLLFDIDGTLYSHNEYMQSQLDLPIKRLAEIQKKTFEQMNAEIAAFQKKWSDTHNGQKISLGNTFKDFGISIEENIKWREELCRPEDYLSKDNKLRDTLEQLASRHTLAVVTNNPVSVAVRTLSILGVHDILNRIIGLDTCKVSKPHADIYNKALQLWCASAQQCVSIGDRYDIDIVFPLKLGMSGILVDVVEDIYKLTDYI